MMKEKPNSLITKFKATLELEIDSSKTRILVNRSKKQPIVSTNPRICMSATCQLRAVDSATLGEFVCGAENHRLHQLRGDAAKGMQSVFD